MNAKWILTAVLALTSLTHADVRVTMNPQQGAGTVRLNEEDPVTGKWRVRVRGHTGNVTFFIKGDTTDPIEYIEVDGDNTGYWTRLVVDGASQAFDIPSIDEVRFDATHGGADVWLDTLFTSGNVGPVEANQVDDLEALGDLTGDLNVFDPATIAGGLANVFIGGDVDASIVSRSIGTISVIGRIGVATQVAIQACAGIRVIEAGSMDAAVEVRGAGCAGIMGRVSVLSDWNGGQLGCYQLGGVAAGDGVFIGGSLTANFPIGTFYDKNVKIHIGGSLNQPIALAQDSLPGQIIINAGNNGGSWVSQVQVGNIPLHTSQSQPNNAPYYDRLSAELGGGAVGLAPFHLHDKDCIPENGTEQTFLQTTTIRLRHYGPVRCDSGDPAIVYYRVANTPTWYPLDHEYWYAAMGADPRDVFVTTTQEDFTLLYDYKIVPSATLKCSDVFQNPPVDDWEYFLYGRP